MTSRDGAYKRARVQKISETLEAMFPDARCVLNFSNEWELLVAVMLSAQCTDVQVNKVTHVLFKKYRTLTEYADAPREEFEHAIFSTGFYRTKAKNIQASARMILEQYGGTVPRTMDELLSLPGVARKTANVVLGNAFGVYEGIAVDTHVGRLSRVLGLTTETDPKKVERDLMKIVPRDQWFSFTYLLIEYGRAYCTARRHDHEHCPLTKLIRNTA